MRSTVLYVALVCVGVLLLAASTRATRLPVFDELDNVDAEAAAMDEEGVEEMERDEYEHDALADELSVMDEMEEVERTWRLAADTPPPTLVGAILEQHVQIKELVHHFVNSTGDEKVSNARALIAALQQHDRRERVLLYPLVVRVTDLGPQMVREHNELALELLKLGKVDLANETAQAALARAAHAALEHIREEERDVLPAVRSLLKGDPDSNKALANMWHRITRSGPPTVAELAEAQHMTIVVLTNAYQSTHDELGAANAKTQNAAKKLLHSIHEHSRCEQKILYPLVESHLTVPARFMEQLTGAHEKMAMIIHAMKDTQMESTAFTSKMSKLIRVIEAYMRTEKRLLRPVHMYLLSHPNINKVEVVKYLQCELNALPVTSPSHSPHSRA